LINRIALPALLLVAILAACGGDDDDSATAPATSAPASATVAATRSPSPSPTEPAPLTWEEFAATLDEALLEESTDPFLDNPLLTENECPNELRPDCGGAPTPTVIQGVVIGHWRSEGFPVPLDEFETELNNYLATGPSLHAIAVKEAEGEDGTPAYYAITAVGDDPTTTAYFIFKEDSGEFRLQAMIFAPVLGEEWLSGECAECYDEWQAW
jgi:hypothetical protein